MFAWRWAALRNPAAGDTLAANLEIDSARGSCMERVTGIGGFFFRTSDPERSSAWYAKHLGVDGPPPSYDTSSWWQQPGPTVFAGMPGGEHFGDPERSWSINFRVTDLDAMVDQLRDAGIQVDVDPEAYPNGRFASLRDPDGNVIQLWQPAGADARGPL